jgi:hypothetical protein
MALYYEVDGVKTEVVEFGPTGQPSALDQAQEILGELFGYQNPNSSYGLLKGGTRPWDQTNNGSPLDDDSLPQQTLIQGDDLSAQWTSILNTAAATNAGNYAYLPLDQNSNTFVALALSNAGIPM